MQVLIPYFSRGGNARKLAQGIVQGVEEVEGANAPLRSTKEVTKEDFLNSQGIIAGSSVYFGVMAAELKKAFDGFVGIWRRVEGKKVRRPKHVVLGSHPSVEKPLKMCQPRS